MREQNKEGGGECSTYRPCTDRWSTIDHPLEATFWRLRFDANPGDSGVGNLA